MWLPTESILRQPTLRDSFMRCKRCGKEFSIVPTKGYCPQCGSFDKELLSGREFNIREVRVI